eukprot:5563683-Karenia_brevis.AAC.1
MCGLHDIQPEQESDFKGRGRGPSFKWVQPHGSQGSVHPKTCQQAKSWRWLADRLHEFVGLSAACSAGARKHRRDLLIRFRKWRPAAEPIQAANPEQHEWNCRGDLPDDAAAAAAGFRRWAKRATVGAFSGYAWWLEEAS